MGLPQHQSPSFPGRNQGRRQLSTATELGCGQSSPHPIPETHVLIILLHTRKDSDYPFVHLSVCVHQRQTEGRRIRKEYSRIKSNIPVLSSCQEYNPTLSLPQFTYWPQIYTEHLLALLTMINGLQELLLMCITPIEMRN